MGNPAAFASPITSPLVWGAWIEISIGDYSVSFDKSPLVLLQNGALNGAILENYVISEILKSYSNCGRECLAHYYRDKDSKEIDLIFESDGELHPIEIKKTASPPSGLTNAFKTLDVSSIKRGKGVVICTKNELSAVDSENFILLVWAV